MNPNVIFLLLLSHDIVIGDPVDDSDYLSYYDNGDSGVAIDFVTVGPPGPSVKAASSIGRNENQGPVGHGGAGIPAGNANSGLIGILLNNPITKLSQNLLESLGLNTRLSVNASPGQGLTIDRELGAFGLNHRDTDTLEWTPIGPSFKKTQTLDAYGAELGKIETENKFEETEDGSVAFRGCNQGDLFGGIFSRCDRLNGLKSSTYNTRFDPTGIGKFFKDTSELLSILNSRKKRR